MLLGDPGDDAARGHLEPHGQRARRDAEDIGRLSAGGLDLGLILGALLARREGGPRRDDQRGAPRVDGHGVGPAVEGPHGVLDRQGEGVLPRRHRGARDQAGVRVQVQARGQLAGEDDPLVGGHAAGGLRHGLVGLVDLPVGGRRGDDLQGGGGAEPVHAGQAVVAVLVHLALDACAAEADLGLFAGGHVPAGAVLVARDERVLHAGGLAGLALRRDADPVLTELTLGAVEGGGPALPRRSTDLNTAGLVAAGRVGLTELYDAGPHLAVLPLGAGLEEPAPGAVAGGELAVDAGRGAVLAEGLRPVGERCGVLSRGRVVIGEDVHAGDRVVGGVLVLDLGDERGPAGALAATAGSAQRKHDADDDSEGPSTLHGSVLSPHSGCCDRRTAYKRRP